MQFSDLQPFGGESPKWEELGNPQISSPLVERFWGGRGYASLRSLAHWWREPGVGGAGQFSHLQSIADGLVKIL